MSEATVIAQDGKTYAFGERAKVKKLSYIKEDGSVVTRFVFRNGVIKEHTTPYDSPMLTRLALHGADQKFGDEFSNLDDVEDCIQAFDDMSERLARNEWSERRQSDGLAGTSLLVRALVEVTGSTVEEVKARLKQTPKEVRDALKRQTKVAAVIARLQDERGARSGKTYLAPDAALKEFVGE